MKLGALNISCAKRTFRADGKIDKVISSAETIFIHGLIFATARKHFAGTHKGIATTHKVFVNANKAFVNAGKD